MLSCTGKRSHRHTILHVSFSNSFGLASARPTPQGLSGAPEIGEMIVKKGAYLYATMSGFRSQRVKGTVKSVLVDDEIMKINLSLYDTDGMEGLYVPSSQFRETTKDVASGAVTGNVDMNTTNTGSSFSQWGMQTMQNAYQKTSNAIGKAIKKNKVKLKYGTFVYLINSKETKSK